MAPDGLDILWDAKARITQPPPCMRHATFNVQRARTGVMASDVLGNPMHIHILTDEYAVRAKCLRTYHTVRALPSAHQQRWACIYCTLWRGALTQVSTDLINRWAYPIVPDSNWSVSPICDVRFENAVPLCAAAAAVATRRHATPDGFALRPCGSGSDGARLCTRTRECASSSPRAGVRRGQRMLSCVLYSSARRSNAALSTTYTYAHASRVYKEANVVPSPLRSHPTPPHRAATPNSCPAAAAARPQPSPCAHGV
jgi:hypothetical protein